LWRIRGASFGVNFWAKMAAALHGGRPSLISRGTLSGGDRAVSEIRTRVKTLHPMSLEADLVREGAPSVVRNAEKDP
jgi:hypothetical protein